MLAEEKMTIISRILAGVGFGIVFGMLIFTGTIKLIVDYITYIRTDFIPYIPIEVRLLFFGAIIVTILWLWTRFTD